MLYSLLLYRYGWLICYLIVQGVRNFEPLLKWETINTYSKLINLVQKIILIFEVIEQNSILRPQLNPQTWNSLCGCQLISKSLKVQAYAHTGGMKTGFYHAIMKNKIFEKIIEILPRKKKILMKIFKPRPSKEIYFEKVLRLKRGGSNKRPKCQK